MLVKLTRTLCIAETQWVGVVHVCAGRLVICMDPKFEQVPCGRGVQLVPVSPKAVEPQDHAVAASARLTDASMNAA